MESYDEKSIKKAYQALGLKAGDVVYLTSSLAMMGRPPNTVKNSTDLCHLFYKPLIDIIGEEGTIIAPAFSYTFGKGSASEPAIFDPQLTSADTGLFPNFLLKQPKVKRTKDPMLSMAYLGGDISSLTQDLDNATYTDNSFLARLAKSKAKFINIGIGVGWLPFVHYIDWLLKSPYRYNKHFNGFIREGEQLKATSWLYSVRALIENSLPDTEEIGISAFNKGIWKKSKLGSKDIYCCNCQEYFEFALNEVKNTPWLVAKGPEVNPLDAEKKRTGEECHPLITSDFNSLVWLKYFKKLRRDLVSDSMSALFYSIEKYFPLNITRILSGEMVYGRAVPERWLLKQAWVKDRQGNVLINIENDDEFFKDSVFGNMVIKYSSGSRECRSIWG